MKQKNQVFLRPLLAVLRRSVELVEGRISAAQRLDNTTMKKRRSGGELLRHVLLNLYLNKARSSFQVWYDLSFNWHCLCLKKINEASGRFTQLASQAGCHYKKRAEISDKKIYSALRNHIFITVAVLRPSL